MRPHNVSLVRYEKPKESVRKAVELSRGLEAMPRGAKVFIKPNIVFWTRAVNFPKWGVITTSRVMQDMVELLHDLGASEITIGEGTVVADPKDKQSQAHAFLSLGYQELAKRYGVKVVGTLERPSRKVDLGDGVELSFNVDALDADFVVDLPVMKTHAQTMVSLGIKNLKGLLDVKSRRVCHNANQEKGLHYMVARLADKLPPIFTLIDGIFTSERGPAFDGRIHRSNVLCASSDILSADLVGCRCLGLDPATVPHLAYAAANHGRPTDLSDIDLTGEPLEAMAKPHEWSFPYNAAGTLPLSMEKMGIKGLYFNKYDSTMCTYCSGLNGVILTAVAYAWTGQPWDEVEVLTGKAMQPSAGKNATILVGKCMYQANKDNPNIKKMLAIKTCPPKPEQVVEALHAAGIMVNPAIFENLDKAPGFFMQRYQGKPEYDESLFRVE